jgi:hypothetical protein
MLHLEIMITIFIINTLVTEKMRVNEFYTLTAYLPDHGEIIVVLAVDEIFQLNLNSSLNFLTSV